MAWAAWLLSLAGSAALGLWLAFLTALAWASASALRGAAQRAPVLDRSLRLAVLIPAHDEEGLISATVRAVLDSDYPREGLGVFVVADNCADRTGPLAEAAGARLLVRDEPGQRGKGFALAFGLERILEQGPWDGVVFLDADARPAPDFLARMAGGLAGGRRIIQGRYEVAEPDRTWFTRLTHLAFCLKNRWQYPGLARFGLSAPLRGTGMCLSADAVRRYGWTSRSLTEDLDFSISLLEAGERIVFDYGARFAAYMPPTPEQAAAQRMRWSAGEADAARTRLRGGFLGGRAGGLGALQRLYLVAPPFSVHLLASLGTAFLGLWAWSAGCGAAAALVGCLLALAHAAYFLLSLADTGLSGRYMGALALIPAYAVWRSWIHVRARLGRGRAEWVRTPRLGQERLRIALMGTRGVPAAYGGFETCVEEVGRRLAAQGHEITVYCRAHRYPDRPAEHLGMRLVHLPCLRRKSLETLSHTALSVLHALFRRYDAHVVFNAANAPLVWPLRLLGRIVLINPDGLEWKRAKWGPAAKCYYRVCERLSALMSSRLIADSIGIRDYYRERYGADPVFIPYGAYVQACRTPELLEKWGVAPRSYFLQITRFEPENNPLLTLRAFNRLDTDAQLVLVGDCPYPCRYSECIAEEAGSRVVLTGYLYDVEALRELWCNCLAYVHGNEVGGTNPALLQAMASGCFVLARDVVFNREVLGRCGRFFQPEEADLAAHMQWTLDNAASLDACRLEALDRVRERYDWDAVAVAYEAAVRDAVQRGGKRPLGGAGDGGNA